ncbi:hypothetical protein ABPG77_008397 [Micractinium sp. CCAP 211/92]
MTWTEEVCANRIQVARTQGTRAGLAQVAKRRLLPAPAPRPNSGVGPIALVGALLAASLCWSREGHKLRGRKLPPLLERLRRLLGGDTGSSARRSVRAAGPAQPRAPPAQQRPPADAVDRRALAAAAAEQRLREQAQASLPDVAAVASATASGNSNSKSGSKKKGGKGGGGKKKRR